MRTLWLIRTKVVHTGLYGDIVFLEFSNGTVRQKGGERAPMAGRNSLFLPIPKKGSVVELARILIFFREFQKLEDAEISFRPRDRERSS